MRVYVGERDPDTGHGRLWVTHELPRPDIREVVEILGELNKLMEFRRDGSVGADYERHRAATIARKDEIVAQLKAAEDVPRPVELVHDPQQSWGEHFDWGDVGTGAADAARSILTCEIGEPATPVVCMAFVADVISNVDARSFRLPANDVWDWIEANRELVERELFDQLPPPDSDPSVPALSIAESHAHADQQEPVELNEASGSAVVRACEQAWRDIQAHHPDLPDVVVILGSGVERGRLVKLGHWWTGRWIADGEARGEVLLAGEALHLAPAEVFEVLLHEAAHGINAARRIPDTSRGGRYHNRRFAATASEVLLHADLLPPYGYAATKLTADAEQRYAATIERLGETMRIARSIGRDVKIGAGAEDGLEGGRGADGSDRGGRRRDAVTAKCDCGRQFRMAPSVYEQGPVVCGHCGSTFRNVAQRNVEREPETSVVDSTFLTRRRAALDAEAFALSPPTPRMLAVLDEERARLVAALDAAATSDNALLSPLHRRLGLIDQLLDAYGHERSTAPVPPTGLQREGIGDLLDGRAPPEDLAAVAQWYETFGTLHEQPMAPGDHPHERSEVARALLKADGTLTGPRLAVGETELLVGDRVISSRDVPAFGLAAGTPGTVEHVDPGHGAQIDFATWGRLELSVTQMLEAGIGHDYVAHDDGISIDQTDVAERLFVEASRIEPGVGW
jgi:hypothetical protein